MSSEKLSTEVIELYQQAISIKNNNDFVTFCHKARYSCERILQIVYDKEIGPLPKTISFHKMMIKLEEKRDVFPLEIGKLFETISATGNPNSHPNDLPEKKRKQQAAIAEQSLALICNWFFNDYLQMPVADDLFVLNKTNYQDARIKNYEDLLLASLEDGILELDEFEQIIETRETLELDADLALNIERKIVQEKLNKKINDLSDILSPADLDSFKKYDNKIHPKPEWVMKGIEKLKNDTEHHLLKGYLKYYFEEIANELIAGVPILCNLLGCWQGWYFQYDSKTYFNLFFIAQSETDFTGYCIEPVNPDWGFKHTEDEPFLFAKIDGTLQEEILFQFQKTMLVKNSWNINYEGVLIEDGQYFEGEWSISYLNGAFNAMKTKSLLPVRIFDTSALKPVVKTQFMDQFRNLTSTWFVQLQGKNAQFGLLHIIDIEKNHSFDVDIDENDVPVSNILSCKIYANLIIQEQGNIVIDYFEGDYVERSKVQIISNKSIQGDCLPKEINFSVDWNSRILSGTIKDSLYKIRSFKGFKI